MSFDPNTEHGERAEADPDVAYALIAARWAELLEWLARAPGNVPEVRGQVASWEDFKRKWGENTFGPSWLLPGYGPYKAATAQKPVDQLGGQKHDLAVAEGNAGSHGYVVSRWTIDADGKVSRVDPSAPTGAQSQGPIPPREAAKRDATVGPVGPVVVAPPPTPSRETLHPGAAAAEKALDEAERKVREKMPPPDPYFGAKVAAVGVAALATVAGTVAASGEARRIGVAAFGAIATGGLAALLFLPSNPKPKDPKS